MSLPTYASFIKDGRIVGIGFCNPGWFLTAEALRSCIKESMDAAWERYREDFKPSEWSERHDKYFTTEADLRDFEYMEVFDIMIPREIAMKEYSNTLTDDEWMTFTKSTGQFNIKE